MLWSHNVPGSSKITVNIICVAMSGKLSVLIRPEEKIVLMSSGLVYTYVACVLVHLSCLFCVYTQSTVYCRLSMSDVDNAL